VPDDFVTIGIGDSREKVSQDGICLSKHLLLIFGDRFGLTWKGELSRVVEALGSQSLARSIGDGLAEMIASTVHVVVEVGDIFRILEDYAVRRVDRVGNSYNIRKQ
jgi:hypothetical protein